MQNLEASFKEVELVESDYVLESGSVWVRVNDLVVYIIKHEDRLAVRVFDNGTAYEKPLDAIELDYTACYSQKDKNHG